MSKQNNKQKIKTLNELFREFNSKIMILTKRQTRLMEKISRLLDERGLKNLKKKFKEDDNKFK